MALKFNFITSISAGVNTTKSRTRRKARASGETYRIDREAETMLQSPLRVFLCLPCVQRSMQVP